MGTISSPFISLRMFATMSVGVIARDSSTPACANSFRAVNKHEGNDRHVELGLDETVVVFLRSQESVIGRIVEHTSEGCRLREDIPRRGVVLSANVPSTILTRGNQQIDVVTANIVLCQIDDSGRQTSFTVMVCSVFTDITDKLCNLCMLVKEGHS